MHFELARADSGDAATALGAMLPDLWRMAARAARARRGLVLEDAPLRAISAGIEHHFAADSWFHRQPTFSRFEKTTVDVLGRVDGGRSRRLGLFAHVASEMALDGALIRREGAALEHAVRLAILAHRAEAARAADAHHGESRRAAGVEPERFEARMTRLLDAVASFELPGGYAAPEGLATRLAGVRASFGMVAEPDDLARWASGFEALAPEADGALAELRWPGRG